MDQSKAPKPEAGTEAATGHVRAGGMAGAAESMPDSGTGWRDGVPVSLRFDDPYYSLGGGLDETRHVFLAGNDLPGRFRDGFHIAELGFGTGLNLLATVLAWQAGGPPPGTFTFTSFEAYPLAADDLAQALRAFPEVAGLAPALLAAWAELPQPGSGGYPAGGLTFGFRLGPAEVALVLGDARSALPAWQGRADAWYLDGFSPARNPELWGEEILAEVARHSAPGASFATYAAAGHVRRALGAAGFDVSRGPGYGTKRHMSRGRLKDPS